MPIQAEQDGNVPFTGARPRYEIIGQTPTLITQAMASGNFDGQAPSTPTKVPTALDPVVSAGRAKYEGLNHGGLFNFAKRPLIIEALTAQNCTAVWTVIGQDGNVTRALPAAFPFKLSAGERLKATSTGASGVPVIGCVVRIDTERFV
jgi:hypothetical protein